MKQSQLFIKTLKEAPKDEQSINAKLLIRGGFVDKLTAGVYSYLPLGVRVIRNVERIVREEMNQIGGQEVVLPALHPEENWRMTKRDKEEIMFKLKGANKKEYVLGWTHEEVVTPLAGKFIKSYKDLPVYLYQIQTKFRNELRAKSGLLRGREFSMKDLYSFHADEKDLNLFYEKVKKAYFKIFKRCGLKDKTFLTLADGGAFSKYSHEFQTLSESGEDEIYLCDKCKIAINKEIIKQEKNRCPICRKKKLVIEKSIETGNIFSLKTRFSEPFNLSFKDEKEQEKIVFMGCYGIGISRLMGTIIEAYHDERGIIWPQEIAPFDIHLIPIGRVKKEAEKLYHDLQKEGNQVLYDDRDKSAGEKLTDADLIGIPLRMVISEKSLQKRCIETKKRDEKKVKFKKYNR